jgi:hypothetical protein
MRKATTTAENTPTSTANCESSKSRPHARTWKDNVAATDVVTVNMSAKVNQSRNLPIKHHAAATTRATTKTSNSMGPSWIPSPFTKGDVFGNVVSKQNLTGHPRVVVLTVAEV